jgi:hypothetical protein
VELRYLERLADALTLALAVAACLYVVGPGGIVQSDGIGGLVVSVIPVVLAGAPLGTSKESKRQAIRVVAGIALFVFVVLGSMSIGLFYSPSVSTMVLAVVAAYLRPRWQLQTK